MQLQTTFYVLAIIYMVVNLFILLAIASVLFLVTRKIFIIQKHVAETVDALRSTLKHPGDMAADVGATVAASLIKRVKDRLDKKKS